jgi:hypothetical protein
MPVSVSKGSLTSGMNFLESMGPVSATEVADKFAGCIEFRQPTSIRGICRAPLLPPGSIILPASCAAFAAGPRLRPALISSVIAMMLWLFAPREPPGATSARGSGDGILTALAPRDAGDERLGSTRAHGAATKAARSSRSSRASTPQILVVDVLPVRFQWLCNRVPPRRVDSRRGPVRTCFRVSCDPFGQHR